MSVAEIVVPAIGNPNALEHPLELHVGGRAMGSTSHTWDSHDPRRFLELRVLADSFAQIQRDRIALQNRLQANAVPPDFVAEIIDNYDRSEKMVGLAMRRSFRKAAPEVVAWLKTDASFGIGEHTMARLLGTIGHPVIATPHHWEKIDGERVLIADPPFLRNLDKLRAYCGVGDPSRKRRIGMTENDAAALGNPQAKVILRLMAELCIRKIGSEPIDQSSSTGDAMVAPSPKPDSRRRSPYRDVYDAARARYAERDWTLGHQHNAALRKVSKEILRDLWLIYREAD